MSISNHIPNSNTANNNSGVFISSILFCQQNCSPKKNINSSHFLIVYKYKSVGLVTKQALTSNVLNFFLPKHCFVSKNSDSNFGMKYF
jgi:hypothetical protein